ncbi:MAG: 50S ribosomal protein L11 methyltransferase [Moraxellaceae bacterium]|nr:50S ribosomal protein L11 methyltransferase [Moraxellaceae bacterium]MDP1776623.1 50S ribosomal protein L11 methyltransferase [Moraxellaceae bacterium]
MSWLQLKIETQKSDATRYQDLLELAGAAAILMEDSGDQPLLEPPPGAQPLWDATRVIGLFVVDSEMDAVVEFLERQLGHALPAHKIDVLEDKDWERAWMDNYHPMCFGDRLWVVPSWTPAPNPDAINLLLDPGLAFGTGTHQTTALCLEWLDGLDLKDAVVVDYGCGSGILAVAALLLGAREAWCVDLDPQALLATRDNAERNGVSDRVKVFMPEDMPSVKADVVVANILAGPLAQLASTLTGFLKPSGQLALSGIITSQVDELVSAYSPWLALDTLAIKDEDWCRLSGRMPSST